MIFSKPRFWNYVVSIDVIASLFMTTAAIFYFLMNDRSNILYQWLSNGLSFVDGNLYSIGSQVTNLVTEVTKSVYLPLTMTVITKEEQEGYLFHSEVPLGTGFPILILFGVVTLLHVCLRLMRIVVAVLTRNSGRQMRVDGTSSDENRNSFELEDISADNASSRSTDEKKKLDTRFHVHRAYLRMLVVDRIILFSEIVLLLRVAGLSNIEHLMYLFLAMVSVDVAYFSLKEEHCEHQVNDLNETNSMIRVTAPSLVLFGLFVAIAINPNPYVPIAGYNYVMNPLLIATIIIVGFVTFTPNILEFLINNYKFKKSYLLHMPIVLFSSFMIFACVARIVDISS